MLRTALLAGLAGAALAAQPAWRDARPCILSPDTAGPLLEDVWPGLPVGIERVAELRRKEAALPWARALLARWRAEAAALVRTPAAFPMERAGWRHDFISRATGEALAFEAERGDAFLVPSSRARESSPAQRAAWVLLAHERQYRLLRGVALLAALDGDARLAAWVADGLAAAAAFFAQPGFGRQDGAWRSQYHHHLYDAQVVSLVADAYGCVRPWMDADQRRAVEEGIFADRLPALAGFLAAGRPHNMTAFVAQALMQAARASRRDDWAALATHAPMGLAGLLAHGLPTDADGRIDGFWCEGTTFYHFYTAIALAGLYEAELAAGTAAAADPAVRERLTALLLAPLALADRELRVPLLGDFGAPRVLTLASYRHLYEWAAGRLDPARFAPVLAAIQARSGAERRDLAALAYGPDALPAPGGLPSGSTRLPAAGIGVLRGDGPLAPYVLLRAGRYIRDHDHPDRLGLVIHAGGRPVSPDLGEPGYGLRGADHLSYHRTTPAHNTLFADEREQEGAADLAWDGDGRGMAATLVDAAGIRFSRRVVLDGPRIVCLDRYEAADGHRFGWIHHADGELALDTALDGAGLGLPPLPERTGWRQLGGRRTGAAAAWRGRWRVAPDLVLHLAGTADGMVDITTAQGPGNPLPETQGVLILRAPGRMRRIATVFEPAAAGAAASTASIAIVGDEAVLRLADGGERRCAW